MKKEVSENFQDTPFLLYIKTKIIYSVQLPVISLHEL